MVSTIYPYQWELLASMLTFKITKGSCIDFSRLRNKDLEDLYTSIPTISVESFRKWFGGRKPSSNALNDLCGFISDVFPYKNWQALIESEESIELLSICQDWPTYNLLLNELISDSTNGRKLYNIRHWVYSRVIELSRNRISSQYVNWIKSNHDENIIDFAGVYSFFMPGQIPPEKYKSIYFNRLEILENGEVHFQNRFNKKKYFGHASLRDSNSLQIILYPDKNFGDGFEYAISIKLDKYGPTAIVFPAMAMGYDGQASIFSYPVLLTTNLKLKIDSPLVVKYFEYCYSEFKKDSKKGSMNCVSPIILQSLSFKTKS